MKLNKLVLKFVSISFSILVMLLVVIGLIKLGSFCYDFGYRVFTEGPAMRICFMYSFVCQRIMES